MPCTSTPAALTIEEVIARAEEIVARKLKQRSPVSMAFVKASWLRERRPGGRQPSGFLCARSAEHKEEGKATFHQVCK